MTSTNTKGSWGGGGVLPVAGDGDLSKTIKEDDCGTAGESKSVKPRGRAGEAVLARRGAACGSAIN